MWTGDGVERGQSINRTTSPPASTPHPEYMAALFARRTIVVTPNAVRLLDPFVHNADNGWFTTVPLRSLDRIPRVLRSRTRNLRRFPLRFVINYRTPTVVASPDHGGFVGQDGTFAAVLAASMNATPVYGIETSANGKISYGYREARDNRSSYGTFGAVVDGRADVSVNGHFLKDYGCYLAELTRHVRRSYVVRVPSGGERPRRCMGGTI